MSDGSEMTEERKTAIARHVGILRQIADLHEALNGLTFRSSQYRDPQPVGDGILGHYLGAIRAEVLAHLEWETGLPRNVVVALAQGVAAGQEWETQMAKFRSTLGTPPDEVEQLVRGIFDLAGAPAEGVTP